MQNYSEFFDVQVTALQPLSHSEGVFGNIAMFRRQKHVLRDGTVILLPQISGNAMRSGLRRTAMWHLLTIIGLTAQNEIKLGKRAVNLLFSGGSLDSSSGNIDVAGYRKLCELIPPLGLFGGGIGNALVPGCLRVGPLIPICEETTSLSSVSLPPEVLEPGYVPQPVAAYMDTFQGTRKELFHDPKFQQLLPEQEKKLLETTDIAKREKKEKGKITDKGDSQQMIYNFETIAAGTKFYWFVGIQNASEVERDCFMTTLAYFSQNPMVAGKSATGFGRISLKAKGFLKVEAHHETSNLPAFQAGQNYITQLKEKSMEIKEWLVNFK